VSQPDNARRPFPFIWLAALALAMALGVLVGRAIPAVPGEGSAETTFLRDMSAHHEQAVRMAVLIRDRTEDPELRTVATDIILTQQSQLGMMRGWLGEWGVPAAGTEPPMGGMGESMGMASSRDVNALATLPASEAEVSFLRLMIRHHQGGVHMAEDALAEMSHEGSRRLAQSIVNAQQSEIDLMTGMLSKRGATPGEPLAPTEHGGSGHN
jgi:uncharacterized protein (DUF305 family)